MIHQKRTIVTFSNRAPGTGNGEMVQFTRRMQAIADRLEELDEQ